MLSVSGKRAGRGEGSPISDILAVTYEDGNNSTPVLTAANQVDSGGPYAGFYVSVGGNVAITTIRGNVLNLANVIAGIIYPIAFKNVQSLGGYTTATVIGLRGSPYADPRQ